MSAKAWRWCQSWITVAVPDTLQEALQTWAAFLDELQGGKIDWKQHFPSDITFSTFRKLKLPLISPASLSDYCAPNGQYDLKQEMAAQSAGPWHSNLFIQNWSLFVDVKAEVIQGCFIAVSSTCTSSQGFCFLVKVNSLFWTKWYSLTVVQGSSYWHLYNPALDATVEANMLHVLHPKMLSSLKGLYCTFPLYGNEIKSR